MPVASPENFVQNIFPTLHSQATLPNFIVSFKIQIVQSSSFLAVEIKQNEGIIMKLFIVE